VSVRIAILIIFPFLFIYDEPIPYTLVDLTSSDFVLFFSRNTPVPTLGVCGCATLARLFRPGTLLRVYVCPLPSTIVIMVRGGD